MDQSNRQPQWENYHQSKSRSGIVLQRIKFRLGETCQGQNTGRVWSKEESSLHINAKELLATLLAFQTFVKQQQLTIQIKIDNMSAVTYISKMEGTKSTDLNLLIKSILDWCQDRQIVLTAEYMSGNQNLVADWHSRNINDSSDWCLNRQIFLQIQKLIGELEVDHFASRLNYQLKKFGSWNPDPMSLATDAFLLIWTTIK